MSNIIYESNFRVENKDYANAGKVSSQIKQVLKQVGVPGEIMRRMSVACYEAEINMIIHSLGGDISFQIDDAGDVQYVFVDNGPGISELEKALTPGWSTADEKAREFGFGAGMGLPNIKRVSDEFDIKTTPQGTTLTLHFKIYP